LLPLHSGTRQCCPFDAADCDTWVFIWRVGYPWYHRRSLSLNECPGRDSTRRASENPRLECAQSGTGRGDRVERAAPRTGLPPRDLKSLGQGFGALGVGVIQRGGLAWFDWSERHRVMTRRRVAEAVTNCRDPESEKARRSPQACSRMLPCCGGVSACRPLAEERTASRTRREAIAINARGGAGRGVVGGSSEPPHHPRRTSSPVLVLIGRDHEPVEPESDSAADAKERAHFRLERVRVGVVPRSEGLLVGASVEF